MPALSLDEPLMWLIAVSSALVAGFIRGFAGFGGPAVMTLILVQFYAPVSVLAKVLLIDLVANLKLLPSTAHEVDVRLTAILVVGSLLGTPLGLYALMEFDPLLIKRCIAVVAVACSVVMLAGWRFRRIPPSWMHAVMGFVSGVVLGATFIALVMIAFLFASPERSAVSRAITVYWAFSLSVALIAGYALTGILVWDDVWRSALVGVFYLAGATAGSTMFRMTEERNFRRAVLWLLLVLSGIALVRS